MLVPEFDGPQRSSDGTCSAPGFVADFSRLCHRGTCMCGIL